MQKTLQALEDEKSNSLRMVEINTYYGKKYGAQADLMKTITLFCIPLLILTVLTKRNYSKNLGGGLMSLVLIIAIIYCGRMWWDIYK